MTKEVKNIIKQDIKKYKQLVEYSNGENQEIFENILLFLENTINDE